MLKDKLHQGWLQQELEQSVKEVKESPPDESHIRTK
jgi:hypothetical protein